MKHPLRWCALGLMLLLIDPLSAVIMVPLSIPNLTAKSDLIVHGTVLSKSCQRDPEGRIYTKVEVQVTDVWKGTATANPLTIVHGGGTLGQERVVVSGQVEYEVGEEVVAFLVRNARGEAVTLGLAQGKFHVWKDPAGGRQFVRNPFHGGSELANPNQKSPASDAQRLTLHGLKDLVKGQLK